MLFGSQPSCSKGVLHRGTAKCIIQPLNSYVYTHWGARSCVGADTLLYKGRVAGGGATLGVRPPQPSSLRTLVPRCF